ncbi:Twin arginine-targeting protein translocase, TatA/E family [Nitrosopumilaceae archaeon]|nr:twin-arginine translocase TatA/TatE family subunit [Nitrosopumilus sp.]CAI9830906.1 Twin arginine-targeting protein translocase, TatA/E family [Nitrosopumilaceae archaeon]MDA7945286.1 twin-arginine translocase TatA/TatE family subunit [Nitrosopumilus sp.]MDA7955262.1 twin-arginine translocase TatA/TatE family subunit [Nitrosopumilus sp.]MDA7974260.1 twin-arginine translocase TatA/TatE family subunit [Nitrosopumilus sp.]
MQWISIAGGEWLIIVFVALVLILGTGRLPGAARRLGRAASDYGRARDQIMGDIAGAGTRPGITGPAGSEREKLEVMARAAGIDPAGMDDAALRDAIAGRLGRGV